MTTPPDEVTALAERRAAARAARDFADADALRAEIEAAGWVVADTADGWSLTPKPAYEVVDRLPDRSAEPDTRRCSVAVVADGWPADVARCVRAFLATSPEDVVVLLLDVGGTVGDALDGPRVEAWHVPAGWGFAQARTALLRADTAAVHVWADPSVEPTGDCVTPLLDALADPAVVGAGGWGVHAAPDWLSFVDAPPGEVDAVLGYLFAMRRSAALAAEVPDAGARFYRNADVEASFAVREATGGRLVATPPLPAVRHRHRGYADSDPAYRDRESRRNYDRFLRRFRGRDDLRSVSSTP